MHYPDPPRVSIPKEILKASPCKDCKDRSMVEIGSKVVTCHAVCQKYKDWRLSADVAKNAMFSEYAKEKQLTAYQIQEKKKIMRGLSRERKRR